MYNDRLQDLGGRAADIVNNGDELDDATRDLVYLAVLAADFDYQVKNGGFGQLLYNLRGEQLEQYDGMLRAVGAEVALTYFVRAANRCIEDLPGYEEFLADFTAPTAVGKDLMRLSVEYLQADTSFDDEVAEFLDLAEARI